MAELTDEDLESWRRAVAGGKAMEGFPAERLGDVQEGDFAEALRLLREVTDTAFRNAELGRTKITIGMNEADKLLARLQPERED